MNIFYLNKLREHAEQAAETEAGPQANPNPPESAAHAQWLKFYYARVQAMAIECAA